MLLGQEKIRAAVQEALQAGEQVRAIVEAELSQAGQLGRAGLLAVTTHRLLFVPEPVSANVSLSEWKLQGTTLAFVPGFLGIEIRLDTAGEHPVRLRRIDGRDLDTLHQALYGEALGSRLPTLGEWKSVLARGVSAHMASADGEAHAAGGAPSERAAAQGGGAAKGEGRRAKGQKGRQQAAASVADSRQGITRAGSRSSASAQASTRQPSAETVGTAPPDKKHPVRNFVLTGIAFGAAVWLGSIAGTAMGEDEIQSAWSPEALFASKAPYVEIAGTLDSLWSLFIVYFIITFFVLLAISKGKSLYASHLFKVNVAATCLGLFASFASSNAAAKLADEITSQSAAHFAGASERAQQGRLQEALDEYRAYLALAPDGDQAEAARKGIADCERGLAEQAQAAAAAQAPQEGAAERQGAQDAGEATPTAANPADGAEAAADAGTPQEGAPAAPTTAEGGQPSEQDARPEDNTAAGDEPSHPGLAAARAGFQKNAQQLARCAERHAEGHAVFTLRMLLSPSGRASDISIELAGDENAALQRCVTKAVSAWRFPRFEGEAVRIEQGFTLEP